MPADAGGTIPAPAIDAGNTVLEPASDAGNTIPTGTIDSGNLNEGPPSDAGTLTPSEPTDAGHGAATDGGTSVIPLPSTNDIYRGLYPHCYQCHSGGARNYFSELEDDSNLRRDAIARDPFFVLPGVPQASELYLLLLGQGDTIGAPQMPPYGDSFETLSANGDTDISIQDVYDWILFMDDIEITDGGFLLMVALKILFWTLALITLPTQASPVGIQDIQSQQPLFQLISPMFSFSPTQKTTSPIMNQ